MTRRSIMLVQQKSILLIQRYCRLKILLEPIHIVENSNVLLFRITRYQHFVVFEKIQIVVEFNPHDH